MDLITKEKYDETVTEMATEIASDAEGSAEEGPHGTVRAAIFEFAEEDVTHHNWFARDYYDGALYGCIIEHSEADTGRYADWSALMEAETPDKTLKRLANIVMEADVADRAFRIHEND